MYECSRSYQRIALGAGVRHMQTGTSPSDCDVDRQNASGKRSQDFAFQPSSQDARLRGVTTLDQQRPSRQLQDSHDGERVKAAGVLDAADGYERGRGQSGNRQGNAAGYTGAHFGVSGGRRRNFLIELGVRLVADTTLGPADAFIETSDRIVDLRLSSALGRVREVLS